MVERPWPGLAAELTVRVGQLEFLADKSPWAGVSAFGCLVSTGFNLEPGTCYQLTGGTPCSPSCIPQQGTQHLHIGFSYPRQLQELNHMLFLSP